MSDVINSIFGRPKNEDTAPGGYAYGSVEPEPVVAEAPAVETDETDVVVEGTESAPEAEATTETADDDAAETGDSEEDAAEPDVAETEDADEDEDVAEAEEDLAGAEDDDTDLDTAEAEPVSADEAVAEAEPAAEDEPVSEDAAAVEAEPVTEAEPVAEAEPVTEAEPAAAEDEPAAARPAAGTRGSTTVADGVVGKIVLRIADQTEGVHSVDESGIKVELADEVAWITIPVVVEFGHAVKALGEQIRVAVIDAVERYLGLDVEVVDVHVTDIHFPDAD